MRLENKIKKHEGAIYTAAYAAAAAGVPGAFIPSLDVAAISAAWVGMILAIASHSNRQLDHNTALRFTTAILAGAAGYIGGSKLFTWALNFIPGVGTVAKVNGEIILVITDGEPDDRKSVVDVIVNATHRLSWDKELGFSFIQVGFDTQATKFLKMLDDELKGSGARFDIVDTILIDKVQEIGMRQVLINALTD